MKQKQTTVASVHLDAIRGCAAMVVFLAHARNIFFGNVHASVTTPATAGIPAATSAPADSAIVTGALGIGHHAVIVFFVLSGYLVGGSVLRRITEEKWSWRRYLTQRLTRLWIVLIPALILGLCLDRAGMHLFAAHSVYAAPPGQSVIQHPVAERLGLITFLGNATFLQTVVVPELGSNVALWSLANEFWYYLAFPLFALAIFPRAAGRYRVGLAQIFFLAFALVLFWFIGAAITLYFSIWLLGAAVAHIRQVSKRLGTLMAVAASILLAAGSAYVRTHPFASQYKSDLLLALICCTLIYGCLHSGQTARPTLYTRVSQHLSGMSYTLYLAHLPALVFLNALWQGQWRPWSKDAGHLMVFAAIIAATLLYAWLLSLLFERNTDRLRAAIERIGREPSNASLEAAA